MTIQEALTYVTCFRELLYGSLLDELAVNIAPELEAAERIRQEKRDTRKKAKLAMGGDGTVDQGVYNPASLNSVRGCLSQVQADKILTADIVDIVDKANKRLRMSARSPTAKFKIGDFEALALIDSGAEVNVMSEECARKSGLGINSLEDSGWQQVMHRLQVADQRKIPLVGWTTASIRIANANFEYHNVILVVLKSCSYPVILGQPFFARSSLWIVNHPDGAVECIAHSQESSAKVFWQAAKEVLVRTGNQGIDIYL
jgi:hypothetical protein